MHPIIQFILSVGAVFLTGVSLFGWGAMVRRLERTTGGSWPVTIGVGLGAVIMIGGIVNLARIAFSVTVLAVAAAGLLFFILHVRRSRSSWPTFRWAHWMGGTTSERAETVLVVALILLVTGFAIATQLPPRVFNYHDDLQKYFAHPVRQLATGTLHGSPLSALGSESLGGMPFLHSFVLSVLPIQYINFVDAVFGLFLLMCLGAAAGWRRLAPLPGALCAPLLIAAIEPQYVNVSALFLGAALMATGVLLVADRREPNPPSTLAMGLVYGGLAALKPTFALFVGLHLLLSAIAVAIVARSVREGLEWAGRTALLTSLALSPWIALHLPHYLDWATVRTVAIPHNPSEPINLLSVDRLFYGATMANYTALAGLALLAALWGMIGVLHRTSTDDVRRSSGVVVASLTALLAYGILVLAMPSILGGGETVLRHAIPFLLGTVPIVVVVAAGKVSSWPRSIGAGAPVVALMAAAVAFVPSLLERYRLAAEYHSILAFSAALRIPDYREYSQAALSAPGAQAVGRMQQLIPAGEPFVAWISLPYLLDFRRNWILDADPAGLASNWARIPPSVRYVMWEHKGYAVPTPEYFVSLAQQADWYMRRIGVRTISFAQSLNARIQSGTVIYSDDQFIVARLPEPADPATTAKPRP